ncbi:hypothetical protein VTK56DRAFT_10189 [Thermocarpiscus australiensis]
MSSSGGATSGSGSPSGSLAKFGCVSCREQHLKCDRVTPTCGRCLNAGRECRPPGLKIRVTTEHKFKFTKRQKWVKTPRRLVFIDESKTVTQDGSSPDSGPDEAETICGSPLVVSEGSSRQTPLLSTAAPSFRSGSPPISEPRSPTDRFMMTSAAPKPLSSQTEAYLFRHFVEKLAIWLDLCDPDRTFEIIVPHRARYCPLLLNSIFALSAQHLYKTGDEKYSDSAASYYGLCLEDLRKHIALGPSSRWNEECFAATIILQLFEEMNGTAVNPSVANHRGHLDGIKGFAQNQSLVRGSLAAASFWVGLRQAIYNAVMRKRPVTVRVNLEHFLAEYGHGETNDYAWANLAVIRCAEVLNFCYGPDQGQDAGRWEELNDLNREWSQRQPASFAPVFEQGQGSSPFPEIWYHRSCQVIGVQHHLLAELFLLRHKPSNSELTDCGASDETPLTAQERIRVNVRKICGIGLGNQWTPPGMFTACMAIAAFGSYFHDPRDQEAMLGILAKTQKDHARPTEQVQRDMLECWGQDV